MPNSRGRATVCESSATKILLSSSQPIAVPGFLIFVIEPLGGPQVNLASTSADDLGTSFSFVKSTLPLDCGPKPAGSSPIKSFKFVGVRKLLPSLYNRPICHR